MVGIPQRPLIARSYRWLLDFLEKSLSSRVPWLHPSWYQLAGLLLSLGALFLPADGEKALVVVVILLLDWFDGSAARARKLAGREGWMLDVTVDRLSEMFLFVPELANGNWYWFAAGLFNIILSHYSVVTNKHRILPLRFFYLLFLAARMVGWLA